MYPTMHNTSPDTIDKRKKTIHDMYPNLKILVTTDFSPILSATIQKHTAAPQCLIYIYIYIVYYTALPTLFTLNLAKRDVETNRPANVVLYN